MQAKVTIGIFLISQIMGICVDSSYLKIMVSEKNLTPKDQVAKDKYLEMADILTDMLII